MDIDDTAKKIADAIFDAIELRRGLIKDDFVEAAKKVLATTNSHPVNARDALYWHYYVHTDNKVHIR